MAASFHLKDLLAMLAAYVGLLWGLVLFRAYPLVGVLLVLGSMALLLTSVASLCGAHTAASDADGENDIRM